jgi:hypothetical protein
MIEARRRMLYASRYVYYRVGVYQDRAPLATTPREGQRGRPALPRHRQAFRSKPSDKARARSTRRRFGNERRQRSDTAHR